MYKGNNIRKIYAESRGIVQLPNTDRMRLSKYNRISTPICVRVQLTFIVLFKVILRIMLRY